MPTEGPVDIPIVGYGLNTFSSGIVLSIKANLKAMFQELKLGSAILGALTYS